jgi:hypothetical protein
MREYLYSVLCAAALLTTVIRPHDRDKTAAKEITRFGSTIGRSEGWLALHARADKYNHLLAGQSLFERQDMLTFASLESVGIHTFIIEQNHQGNRPHGQEQNSAACHLLCCRQGNRLI